VGGKNLMLKPFISLRADFISTFDANGILLNVGINIMGTLKLPLHQNDFIMQFLTCSELKK
jgi:hypothetical protein